MEPLSHNHINYQARIDYIKRLLVDNFGLSDKELSGTKTTPIQYEADFPFKYNNFVYRISFPLDISTRPRNAGLKQAGCVPIPAGAREFIMRLSNADAEGMYRETRVQNEVAILTLASAALQHIEPHIVPRVFGWGPATPGRLGWILQDLMPGVPLEDIFDPAGSLEQKKDILGQMARILKGLQDYQLPKSIKGWGGLTFDDSGAIISASMPSVGAGPWQSLDDSYRGRLKVALRRVEDNPYLRGWRFNGIKERVEDFIERGLPKQFADLPSRQDRAIIHADFTSDNLLFDPETGRLTALLDYDFSSILHPAYEFFRSFGPNGGRFTGWMSDKDAEGRELGALRMAKLTGRFPSPLPTPVMTQNGPGVDWQLAQAWEDELQKHHVNRPSTIEGIDKLADVDELLGALAPWRLINKDFLRMNTDEGQRQALKRMAEEQLVAVLEHIGF
ncbi:phosphotransferase enzyme family-domain-containing protein [Rhypophila decipiens]|uniref:Phosphotransferase enzyme family-domain-containing protein n=1 Tax=Rhypophila decipiens TaxID=261697 RepID=A0AAN7B770_9PEZI|nr:phosphotransferase enzyme family-domain-containing protein [Rhypophila decipiens]